METALIALASAVLFALGNVIARFGLKRHASPFSSTVMFAAGAIVMWLLVLLGSFTLPSSKSLPFFAIRGVLDPGFAAILVFISLRKLGVSLTIPIVASAAFVSTLLSVVFLGEQLTWFIVLGTSLILFGVSLLSFTHGRAKGNLTFILVAALGSFFIGTANFITKLALNISDASVSGVAIAFSVGLVVHAIVILVQRKWEELPLSFESARVFLLAGVFIAAAYSLSFVAFSLGQVNIVAPLIATQPLFALFLSYAFMRKYEAITKNVILGTIMVVIGASMLTAF